MTTILTRFVGDQSGAITIEDGLAVLFVGIGIFAVLSLLSTAFGGLYAGLDFLKAAH
jgi:Flp pilus assembly pilin Flp